MAQMDQTKAKLAINPFDQEKSGNFCISLIGMAGAGKTTIGRALAARLCWAFMDTDYLLESLYAAPLQAIGDRMGREDFLDLEAEMICQIRPGKCVVATGGSVIYRESAMRHLEKLGPIVHIYAGVEAVKERIALKPDRGLVLAPGQSLESLYAEREALYQRYATLVCHSEKGNPDDCALNILEQLRKKKIMAV